MIQVASGQWLVADAEWTAGRLSGR